MAPRRNQPRQDGIQRREKILAFIQLYRARYGYGPTMREIGIAVGVASSNTIHYHLVRLEKDGQLQRIPGVVRSATVVHPVDVASTVVINRPDSITVRPVKVETPGIIRILRGGRA